MLSELSHGDKVIGFKQTKRAVIEQTAVCVFLAEDADPALRNSLLDLCIQRKTKVVRVRGMRELGIACGIDVGAAAAALIKG